MTDQELVKSAWEFRDRAAATYSNYPVGAALLSKSGKMYGGCNVESSSYGLSCCAERVALFKAVSEGEREFVKIAVVAEAPVTATPCGACRQLLSDYCGELEILLSRKPGELERVLLSEIFARPFVPTMLK
ncbi:cytidine deaminase [candidate division KSB1 bacterium]|nr:cytidine deaminase [candidate division KSB1 bacterium]